MQMTARPEPGTVKPSDLSSLEPVDANTVDEVKAAIAEAREAQKGWASKSLDARAKLIEKAAETILDRHLEVLPILAQETGRSETECLASEVATSLDYVKMAVKEARVALAPAKMPISKLEYPGKKATVEAVARGVVGIIAPWNYPLGNFNKSVYPALLAGNAVVLKPSEHTPRSGAWLGEVLQSVLPKGLVHVVQGGGEIGAAVLENGVDAIVFTGSVATGKKIAQRAGELLIPHSVELGGKDAAIVLADCNFDRTVAGILQWGFHNCGQNCAGIERVYVEAPIYDKFVSALGAAAKKLKIGKDLGPLQNHAQLEIVERHVDEAKEKGARVLAGAERSGDGLGFAPTVLADCDEEMLVMSEETFGPVLAVAKIADANEGVRRANASPYGLNGSVWTTNISRGEKLARQLDVGLALVNNHAIPGALAQSPWTGTKDTGTGTAASRYAYPTFVRRQVVFVDTNKDPDPWWMPINDDTRALMDTLILKQKGSLSATLKLLGLLKKRVGAIKELVSPSA
jgi:acyl-CoA reductase-like NAD-dependent aldehyde dehydrogenase